MHPEEEEVKISILPKCSSIRIQLYALGIIIPIILFCLIFPLPTFATSRLDSLVDGSKSTIPTQKVNSLLELAHYYSPFNALKSLKYATEALAVSKAHSLLLQEIEAHNLIGDAFVAYFQLDSAKTHYSHACRLSKEQQSPAVLSWSYIHISNFYSSAGLNDSVLFFLKEAEKIAAHEADIEQKASINHAYGTYYHTQKVNNTAIDYYNKSLKLWEQLKYNIQRAKTISEIADIYLEQNNYGKAQDYYLMAYNISTIENAEQEIANCLYGLAMVNDKQKNYSKAQELYTKAKEYFIKSQNETGIAESDLQLARIAYGKGNINDALLFGQLAVSESKSFRDKNIVYEAYNLLASTYLAKKDYKQAFESEKKRKLYADSIHNNDIMKKMTGIRMRYLSTQSDADNKALRATKASQQIQLQRQKNIKWYISIILVFTIAISLVVYLSNNSKKKSLYTLQLQKQVIKDKNTELATLNAEILDQKKQLEVTNNFKNKLFSIVSHDFRSPLLSLKSFLFLLEDSDLTHEEVKMMTKDITERVNVTSDFLENLLNWSQSQLQGFKSYKRLVDVHIVTEELFYLFKGHAESKGIVLTNEVPNNTELLTDANTIKLVLRNLITNAIKFTVTGEVKVNAYFKDAFIIISVKDTGIGVNDDIKMKLFSGDNASSLGTANEKGSGLGLLLCKEFVEGNGGSIWMETEVGKGSAFYFSLPIIKESE